MVKKFNISEAAADILAGTAYKRAGDQVFGGGKKVAADEQGMEDIGRTPRKNTEPVPTYTKGVPSATAHGATPPVGQQPAGVGATKATGPQDSQGRSDLVHPTTLNQTSDDDIRDRKKYSAPEATQQPNKGAIAPYVPEETESEDEVISEAGKKDDESMAHEKKEKMKMKMKEDIDAMFEGEELTEDFKSKASTIYEASVLAHAKQIAEEVEVKLTEQFESALEEIKEDFADKIDDYLNYMVEEWMKENELAIEKGLRSEIVEDFIGGLRDLFAEHYIDIPTEKVDLVGELAEQVESLEDKLNEEIQRGVQLRKELVEHKKVEAVHSVGEGLLLTQAEKLKELAEGVEFSSEEEFVDKLIVMKESYFPSVVKSAESSALDEILIEEVGKKPSAVSHDPSIDAYAKAISKSVQR